MKRRESGFTIIETSLVLAVTGLVIAMVLVGIGNSLNHQRYIDAVNQAVDFFRGQYTQTSNTLNDRSASERCDASGVSVSGSPMPRGSSDCLLLGKVIRSSNGQDMKAYQVLALNDPSDNPSIDTMTDTDIFVASQLREGNEVNNFTMDWGSRLVRPGTQDDAAFTMMVIRTPVTGTVHTYTSDSDTVSVTDLLSSAIVPQVDRSLCVDQTGFVGSGVSPMGIRIVKGAANSTGVQVIPAGECT